MRILFAITQGNVGGAQEHLRILAGQLVERGHSIQLLTEADSQLSQRFRELGVESLAWHSIRRDPHPIKDLRARQELRRAVEQFSPDVLHLSTAKAGVLGRGLTKKTNAVTIYTCHHPSFGPNRELVHRLIGRPTEQLTLRLLDGIISDGSRDAAMLQDFAPNVPLRIIPNTVPVPADAPIGDRSVPVALWVARFASPKNPLLAVEAWRYVVEARPDAKLIMCGTGPLLESVRERVKTLRLEDNIDVRGFVEQISPLYADASLFLLTTKVEGGITMATLEAMSHRLVPVISDAGDLPVVGSLGCGYVVGTNPKSVASVILNAISEPAELARRGEAARTLVARYTPEHHAADVERFYQSVISNKRQRQTR